LILDDMSLIRGASLQGYPDLVTELGADPLPLLRAAGVRPAAVGDPEAWIDFDGFVAAVETAASITDTPDFGRRLALRQGVEILGPVGAALRTASTAGEAMAAASRYLSVYSPALRTELAPTGRSDRVALTFHVLVRGLADHRQSTELALGVMLRVLRLLLGPRYSPLAVDVPHDAIAPRADYVRYFGCKPRFAAPLGALEIATGDLGRPVSAESGVHAVVRSYLHSIAPPADGQLVDGVQRLIRHLLPTGALSLSLVAGQLLMHPRTLQRQLADAGRTFDQLVDETRRDLAAQLLRDTDMPMTQIAGMLAFCEACVLTRACRRWFAMTPSAYRKAAREARKVG
jgi:AraC-like DNA-binding protein